MAIQLDKQGFVGGLEWHSLRMGVRPQGIPSRAGRDHALSFSEHTFRKNVVWGLDRIWPNLIWPSLFGRICQFLTEFGQTAFSQFCLFGGVGRRVSHDNQRNPNAHI